jgi:hypothetical protein
MSLLVCSLLVLGFPDSSEPSAGLLEQARDLERSIAQGRVEGRDVRGLARQLLDDCTRLRRAHPGSLALCLDEAGAAALAGDWAHALLACRLAQRLDPADGRAQAQAVAAAARLQVSHRPPALQEEAAASLAERPRVRLAFWALAALLYLLCWVRIGAGVAGRLPPATPASFAGIVLSVGLVAALFWADAFRERRLGSPIGIIRRGEPAQLREGNGLSYPVVIEERLRPGTEVAVLGTRGKWIHVRTAGGLTGWTPGAAVEVE